MTPERDSLLEAELAAVDCGALLVVASSSSDPDLAPFVGPVHLGQSFVLALGAGTPLLGFLTDMEREEAAASGLALLTPRLLGLAGLQRQAGSQGELWSALLRRSLAESGLEPGRVALAGHGSSGVLYEACSTLTQEGWSFVSGHALVRRLRKRKRAAEIEEIRRAAAGICAAMRGVAGLLASATVGERGVLESDGRSLAAGDLRSLIAQTLAVDGLFQPEGNIVACGRDAGIPHSQGSSERPLCAGEAIIIDLYPKGRLFADCTRTLCVGEPPEPLERAHREVRQTLERAHLEAHAGASGWDLQILACDDLGAAGYRTPRSHPGTDRGYVHGLGHGVGYELHELPSFRKGAGEEGVLAVGDVFTLEPGIYEPEAGFGVRLEDLCVLGPQGAENLTPLPYALDPRAWAD